MTRHITRMEIDDAEHYTPEQRQAIIDAYPEHEREARTKGIPSLGSGRVSPISEETILCDAFTNQHSGQCPPPDRVRRSRGPSAWVLATTRMCSTLM
jgi:hypothetical protein